MFPSVLTWQNFKTLWQLCIIPNTKDSLVHKTINLKTILVRSTNMSLWELVLDIIVYLYGSRRDHLLWWEEMPGNSLWFEPLKVGTPFATSKYPWGYLWLLRITTLRSVGGIDYCSKKDLVRPFCVKKLNGKAAESLARISEERRRWCPFPGEFWEPLYIFWKCPVGRPIVQESKNGTSLIKPNTRIRIASTNAARQAI